MKKGIFFPAGIILVSILFFAKCGKGTIEKNFVGNFNFSIHYTYSTINNYHSDTSYFYSGNISLNTDENYIDQDDDNHSVPIKIQFKNGWPLTPEVFRDGQFLQDGSLHGGFSGGYSDNDHLHFVIEDGGLGYHWKYDVTGVRR